MNANRKIMLIILSMLTLLTLIITALVALSSRQSGYEGAKKRAYLSAEIVKNALTAHMVNGMMENRDIFLDSMKRLENIQDLWIVRAPSVTTQFGKPHLNEMPRDAIDEKVLSTGEELIAEVESLQKASLRVTIPYIASANDKPNCLTCHNAEEGEVLGAISLRFDIQDDRIAGIISIIKILGTSIIFLGFILWFISRKIMPYTSTFDSITDTLKSVHEGDYTVRAQGGIYAEDREATMWLNEIVEKLETVLNGIERNLTSFVHNRQSNVNNDKLLSAQEIIQDIAEIYNFKKTIESDLSKEDIYYRLAQVFTNTLGIKHFTIFENDLLKNERSVAYMTEGCQACCALLRDVKERCRAERTDMVIQSDHFPEVCREAACGENHYICIPFLVSDQKSITLSIVCKDPETLKAMKYQIGIVKKYLEEAKPILESRMLMDVLRERNFVDGLTGLYNRKYLDDFTDNRLDMELANGTDYALMLLDVDYFKMVNDTYGHDAGDAILQKLSSVMREQVSEEDFIVRFGGEEFLIVVRNPTEESVADLAERINREFAQVQFRFNNETFSKTVSIGYAFFPSDTDRLWHCIKYADVSLYEAKESGRNRVVRFHQGLLKSSEALDY